MYLRNEEIAESEPGDTWKSECFLKAVTEASQKKVTSKTAEADQRLLQCQIEHAYAIHKLFQMDSPARPAHRMVDIPHPTV
jgi:hypothetical protein